MRDRRRLLGGRVGSPASDGWTCNAASPPAALSAQSWGSPATLRRQEASLQEEAPGLTAGPEHKGGVWPRTGRTCERGPALGAAAWAPETCPGLRRARRRHLPKKQVYPAELSLASKTRGSVKLDFKGCLYFFILIFFQTDTLQLIKETLQSPGRARHLEIELEAWSHCLFIIRAEPEIPPQNHLLK